jgi:hypothetical protein
MSQPPIKRLISAATTASGLIRASSAMRSDPAKEGPSGRVLRDGSSDVEAVRLGGSSSAQSTSSGQSVASKKEEIERRRTELKAKQAARDAKGGDTPSGSASERSAMSHESVASKRAALEERKRKLEALKAYKAAPPDASNQPAGAAASPDGRALTRGTSACRSNASKDGPSASPTGETSARSSAYTEYSVASPSVQSQKDRIDERRRLLEARKRQLEAARTSGVPAPPLEAAESTTSSAAQRERLEERRKQLAERQEKLRLAKVAKGLSADDGDTPARPAVPPLTLSGPLGGASDAALRSSREIGSSAIKEGPSRSTRSAGGLSSAVVDSKRAVLEERKRQLAARKELAASDRTAKAARASALPSERTLQRGSSAMASEASKEAPSGRLTAADGVPSSRSSSSSASSSIADQKERLEERRRELAARKAAKAAKAAALETCAASAKAGEAMLPSDRTLQRGSSAMASEATKDAPGDSHRTAASDSMTSKRSLLEEKRAELAKRKAALDAGSPLTKYTPTTTGAPPMPQLAGAPPPTPHLALPAERLLSRGSSACRSDASVDAPSGSHRSAGSAASSAKRAALDERRRELREHKQAVQASKLAKEPIGGGTSGETLPSDRTLQRGSSAMASEATKEAPTGSESHRSGSSDESTASKRALLEEKKRQLLARKAAKEGRPPPPTSTHGAATPPLERGMSACKSESTKETPTGRGSHGSVSSDESTASKRALLEARRREVMARQAAREANKEWEA